MSAWVVPATGAVVVGLAATRRRPPWIVAAAWWPLSILVVRAPTLAAVATTGAGIATLAAAHWREARRHRITPADLADALESVARALRAGASPRQSLAEAAAATPGPVGDELHHISAQIERGLSLPLVLRQWPARHARSRGLGLAAAALRFAIESGASAARAVDDVADSVRAQAAIEAEVRALASQAQASAVLMGLLPFGFLVVAGTADPATVSFLLDSSTGRACLVGGVGLQVTGWLWMRRIVAEVH